MDNDLLFLGRVRGVRDNLSLTMDIVSADGSPLLSWRYGVPVKLSLYRSQGDMLVVGGKVYAANAECWRISGISAYQNAERRGFFRVQAYVDCSVQEDGEHVEVVVPEVEKFPARIINISLSGVLFSSKHRFIKGEVVVLDGLRLAQDQKPFCIRCVVLDSDAQSAAGYMHRCKFLALDGKESDRLCKAIFYLQREAIKKRKGGL